MVQFQMANDEAGRGEMLRGWYHSWVDSSRSGPADGSGIPDMVVGYPVSTSILSSLTKRTMTHTLPLSYVQVSLHDCRKSRDWRFPHIPRSRAVDALGRYRANHRQGYTPPSAAASQYQSIPLDKIEDFGVHANQYYQLKVEIYKTKLDEQLLDLLWNKYWVATLSQSLIVSVSLAKMTTFGS
jgi:COP9 signalosome complex subunit 5